MLKSVNDLIMPQQFASGGLTMKAIALFVPCLFASTFAFATSYQRSGSFEVGFDEEANMPITKEISVQYSGSTEDASLKIEGEGTLSATKEKFQVSGYVASPKKYFYYTLDMNPKTAKSPDSELVIAEEQGSSRRLCKFGTNAVLTAYKGDGTKRGFCVTFK